MAESERVLRRLVRTPERLHALLLSPSRLEGLSDLVLELPATVPVLVADLEIICAIAGFHVHRGVLATGIRPTPDMLDPAVAFESLRGRDRLTILAGEGITNVDNIGGLFRNAAAFGVDGVLLDPTSCDPLYRKAIRVSAGHVLSTPYAIATDWPRALDRVREMLDVSIVAADTGPEAVPIWSRPRADRELILLGSEARGVTPAAIERCDAMVEVPMAPGVPSMNVATASAVFLYERMRSAGAAAD